MCANEPGRPRPPRSCAWPASRWRVEGAAALSLRAIARDLGMVSSAIYRYFPSRDDLLTALIIDSYDRLGAAVEAADACGAPPRRLPAPAGARRRTPSAAWAVDHPSEWALLFGTPVPGYAAPQDTIPSATRYAAVLVAVLTDMAAAGLRHELVVPEVHARRPRSACGASCRPRPPTRHSRSASPRGRR